MIAREGIPFIVGFFVAGFILVFLPLPILRISSLLFFLLSFFSLYFFRDPKREIVQDPSVILCPADGTILEIAEEESPYFKEKVKVVKIFMSIFNVHIQRSPIQGEVEKIVYQTGKFLDTRDLRASFENENNTLIIKNDKIRIAVKQIAGLLARRIVCRVHEGKKLEKGEKFGMIRFGSQVDIFLSLETEILVKPRQKVMGGITVFAKIS